MTVLKELAERADAGSSHLFRLIDMGLSARNAYDAVQVYRWVDGLDLSTSAGSCAVDFVIDIGAKRDGFVSARDLGRLDNEILAGLSVGDQVPVFVLSAQNSSGELVLSLSKGKELDEDAPDTWPWEDSSLAALGLDKPEGAMDLKTDLLEAWERAVDGVNPGVFGRPLTSQAKKKTGVLSVT